MIESMDDASDHLDASAELLVHVGRRAVSDARSAGLTPVQWSALHYFARANRFSRTASAFASFQATTRGTASQTVKSLLVRGYLERHAVSEDRRSARFEPTRAGLELLEHDPFFAMKRALAGLTGDQRSALRGALTSIMEEMSRSDGGVSFGTCQACVHLAEEPDGNCHFCLRESAPLDPDELDSLCVHFEPRGA